jgi:hypothetical protein
MWQLGVYKRYFVCRLEVAVLEYHAVPVLALQHLVVPLQSPHIPGIVGSCPSIDHLTHNWNEMKHEFNWF